MQVTTFEDLQAAKILELEAIRDAEVAHAKAVCQAEKTWWSKPETMRNFGYWHAHNEQLTSIAENRTAQIFKAQTAFDKVRIEYKKYGSAEL